MRIRLLPRLPLLAALLLVSMSSLQAKVIAHAPRGFTLEVPDDWEQRPSNFLVAGPDDIYLTEIRPTGNTTSVSARTPEMVSAVATMVLKMQLRYQELGERVVLDLPQGRVIQRRFVDAAGRQVMQWVIGRDGHFWQFLVQAPPSAWDKHRDTMMKVLHSVKLDTPAAPADAAAAAAPAQAAASTVTRAE